MPWCTLPVNANVNYNFITPVNVNGNPISTLLSTSTLLKSLSMVMPMLIQSSLYKACFYYSPAAVAVAQLVAQLLCAK